MLAEESAWYLDDAALGVTRLHDLVIAQARRRPDRTAVIGDGGTLTYGELTARAERIAHLLRRRGLAPGGLAGLFAERSVDALGALLGVVAAGGAWVPLDPALPGARLAEMLDDARPSVVIAERRLADRLPASSATVVYLDELPGGEVLTVEPARQTGAEDVAYVMFTSGSTGRPKGVEVPHRAVVNLLASMQVEPGFGAEDVLLALTTWSFDISILELFLPLVCGGRVVIADRDATRDPGRIARLVEQHGVTVMQATPSTWRMLVAAGWKGSPRLRALSGGEPLPRDLADALGPRCGELWNMYGPTETTIWSTVHRVQPGAEIAIGRAVARTRLYVLDERGARVPAGETGELHIAGAGVARGYRNRPELTAERFVKDLFHGGTMYRTGDLARELPDGTLMCLGRVDQQVKIRGHRIELEDVEAGLRHAPGVRDAVVVTHEDPRLGKHLIAGVVMAAGATLDVPRVRRALAVRLPGYMIPEVYHAIDSIPATANGKTDRRRAAELLARPGAQPLRASGETGPAPLSFAQEGHWLLDRIAPGLNAYHIPAAYRLRGALEVGRLERALERVIARHDALRTAYVVGADGQPRQQVQLGFDATLEVHAGGSPEEVIAELMRRPFRLDRGPLLRAALVRVASDDHVLALVAHHIAADGHSCRLLVEELAAEYAGRGPAAAPALAYADHARWERRQVQQAEAARAISWWKEALARPEPTLYPLCGPAARIEHALPTALVRAVRDRARQERVTPFTVLLAAWCLAWGGETGVDDVQLGVPVSTRVRPEVQQLVGLFVNVLVHRASLAGDPTGRELIDRLRTACRDAHAHGAVPYELLLRELGAPRGLAAVHFGMEPGAPAPLALGEARGEELAVPPATSVQALTIQLIPRGDELVVYADYRTDVLDHESVARALASFEAALARMASDPGAPAGAAPARSRAPAPAVVVRAAAGSSGAVDELLPLWREVLGLPDAAPEESFFDLGGHSLLAVELFGRVEARLGRRPSRDAWLAEPTLIGLARQLERPRPAPAAAGAELVPLNRVTSASPFVWIHGLSGAIFTDLLPHLPADVPWYGFRIADEAEVADEDVSGIAARYVELLRRVQPHGPYALGGYCFGGLVGLEMARQLTAAGERIDCLVIIELSANSLRTAGLAGAHRAVRRIARAVRALTTTDPAALAGMVAARARALVRRITTPADDALLANVAGAEHWTPGQRRRAATHFRAAHRHVVAPYAGAITLIRGTEPVWRRAAEDDALGWREIAGGVDVRWVDGAGHTDIVHEPHARRAVAAVGEAIRDARAGRAGEGKIDGR